MTMCVFTGAQCCCQPQDGTACPEIPRYRWDQDDADAASGFMVGPVAAGEWVKWADVQRGILDPLKEYPGALPEGCTPGLPSQATLDSPSIAMPQGLSPREMRAFLLGVAAAGSAALPPPPPDPAWKPEPPCWLVERHKEGRTTGYLGHANGSYEWMPTPDKATRFVRREDANGVAECIETEDVIVAEHIWG